MVVELSKRYVYLYERITGLPFDVPSAEPINDRMRRNIQAALK